MSAPRGRFSQGREGAIGKRFVDGRAERRANGFASAAVGLLPSLSSKAEERGKIIVGARVPRHKR